ncbi:MULTISPECIES: hypothetical protein [unclassified Hoeflea]|jgi:hypothetical protein|uniref:hypothetical protein n=1 Tax=unclassified Hoeflea TaxID=2614931 RepID=UPI002AFEB8B2|nr:hypothetical protein [Hoeflea sp.]
MTLYHIHLTMARNKEFPEGNPRRGYDIHAPLDAEGHLDQAAWEKSPSSATVTRFWDGERSELGYLVHHPKGGWIIDYEPDRDDDDETGFRFSNHVFKPGEYVSIRDHGEDELHTFVVASVEEAK